jgi:hypothetical protein
VKTIRDQEAASLTRWSPIVFDVRAIPFAGEDQLVTPSCGRFTTSMTASTRTVDKQVRLGVMELTKAPTAWTTMA